jgi:hypothetical protein
MRFTSLAALVAFLPLAAPVAAQLPGPDIILRGGINFTEAGDAPPDVSTDRGFGWQVGADLPLGGGLFSIQPGLHYQHLAPQFSGLGEDDGVGINGFWVPVMGVVRINAIITGLRAFAGPTMHLVTGVGDNDFDLDKDDFSSPFFGGMIGAGADLFGMMIDLGWETTFTDVFDGGDFEGGKLNTFRITLGFGL